ncbi:MAG: beta-ketoacyl-ACP synthase II [Candidatus Dormibacteria bacterium]
MSGASNGRVRVVVTGIGAVTPLGLDVESSWDACRRGRSGVVPISLCEASDLSTRIAGEVKGFDAAEHLGPKEARRTSRCVALGLAAARQAVADSGFDVRSLGDEVGVLVASGIGGLEWLENAVVRLNQGGPRRVSPFTIPAMIPDMTAGRVAIEFGARGPNFAAVSACASSGNAIGEAAEWIRRGDALAVIAGGTEAAICRIGIATFNAMQAMSTRNDEPEKASRPFDKDRDGFVMGEGSGMLILEEYEHARRRDAHIYAEVVGYGATDDAIDVVQPDPAGTGACRCVQRALHRAGVGPDEVDYVNAHGTSTQLNDAAETRAVKAALGARAATVPISSTKSMTGHLLGAAGGVEAIFSILAIRDNFVPPTINLDEPDPECDLDYVPNVGRSARVDLAISTSYGFGGHNACLAFARVDG